MTESDSSTRRFVKAGAGQPERSDVHLVVGYDRHNDGPHVVHAAADLATRLGAAMHIVHAVSLADYPAQSDASLRDDQSHLDAVLRDDYAAIAGALAGHQVAWTFQAAHGDPRRLLRAVADEWDALMFVVGSRGETVGSWLTHLLDEPSVTHGLINHSHRLVTVVPEKPHR